MLSPCLQNHYYNSPVEKSQIFQESLVDPALDIELVFLPDHMPPLGQGTEGGQLLSYY